MILDQRAPGGVYGYAYWTNNAVPVHLSDSAGPTSWAKSAELAKPAEQSQAVHPRDACQRARL